MPLRRDVIRFFATYTRCLCAVIDDAGLVDAGNKRSSSNSGSSRRYFQYFFHCSRWWWWYSSVLCIGAFIGLGFRHTVYSMCDELRGDVCLGCFFEATASDIDFVNRKQWKMEFCTLSVHLFDRWFRVPGHACCGHITAAIRLSAGKNERTTLSFASCKCCGGAFVLFFALSGVPTLSVGPVLSARAFPLLVVVSFDHTTYYPYVVFFFCCLDECRSHHVLLVRRAFFLFR